jgi:hypothetical protein
MTIASFFAARAMQPRAFWKAVTPLRPIGRVAGQGNTQGASGRKLKGSTSLLLAGALTAT